MSIVSRASLIAVLAALLAVPGAPAAPARPRGVPSRAMRPEATAPPAMSLPAPEHLVVAHYKPRIVLRWSHPGELVTGFEIERAVGDARFTRIATAGRQARSFRDPTSHLGVPYVYRVRAVGLGIVSPYSTWLIVTAAHARPGARSPRADATAATR